MSRKSRLASSTTLGGAVVYGDPLKDDFKVFLYAIWKHLNLPDPTRSQYVLAEWLQNGPSKLVIEAFRGIGKSIVTEAFVCWLLLRNPQLKIMVVSASKTRADSFSTFVLKLIREVPFLKHLAPRKDQRSSAIMFDVGPATASEDSPSLKSVGIMGQITGSRADIIIADDIEVPGNSATQGMREKLKELIKEFAAILKPLPSSKIIYLGTPQTEQSLYNVLPARGYEIRIIPAKYPTEAQRARYGDRLAAYVLKDLLDNPSLAGKPVCSRFDEATLIEKMAEYGQSGFALQFMLDTSLADADRYPLKLRDLIFMDLDKDRAPVALAWANDPSLVLQDVPLVGFDGDKAYRPMMVSKDDWQPYTGRVMAIDPSGRGTDETTYAVVNILNGRLFLMDAGGFSGGYEESTLEALAMKAKEWGVNEVTIEPNFGDGMFNKLIAPVFQRIYPVMLTETPRAIAQKERRIVDTLEPVIAGHRLVINRKLLEDDYESTKHLPPEHQNRYRLFFQLTRITRDRGSLLKDDRIDALSWAVARWVDAMARDTEKAAEQTRKELLTKALQDFMRHAVGGRPMATSIIPRGI